MMKSLKKSLVILMLGVSTMAQAVDVNQATAFELEATRGIGQKMAQEIVSERAAHGIFKSWDDFKKRVKGVGERNILKMKNDGLSLKPQAEPAK